jgi:hypothetical protein
MAILDSCVGLALECLFVLLLDAPEKCHGGLVLGVDLLLLLLLSAYASRSSTVVSIDGPADLEPSSAVSPITYLLTLDAIPPRLRLTGLSDSMPDISTLLPIVQPTVLDAAMLLHPAYLSDHVWACIAT